MNVLVGTVAGAAFALHYVLRGLHRRGRLLPLLKEAAVEQVLVNHTSCQGLSVSDAELQQADDRFRRRHGLISPSRPTPGSRSNAVQGGQRVRSFRHTEHPEE
jgi:hypothetical protein